MSESPGPLLEVRNLRVEFPTRRGTLVAMVLSVNLLGDWLRDALNPRLR